MSRPYKESRISSNSFIRKFESDTQDDELTWHMDKCDRIVKIICGSNWMYQEEDSLPIRLYPGDAIEIKKETWHRVIRGEGPLEVLIEEII